MKVNGFSSLSFFLDWKMFWFEVEFFIFENFAKLTKPNILEGFRVLK